MTDKFHLKHHFSAKLLTSFLVLFALGSTMFAANADRAKRSEWQANLMRSMFSFFENIGAVGWVCEFKCRTASIFSSRLVEYS